jgi:hypothetical protein
MTGFLGRPAVTPEELRSSLPGTSNRGEKRCPACGIVLPLTSFGVDRSRASGRANRCRPCDNARSRAYYQANRERVIARVLAHRKRGAS